MDKCREYGSEPDCLGDVDPRYTMNWDDIGEAPMLYCSHCGPIAKSNVESLMHALETRGPKFALDLDRAIQDAKNKLN